MPSTGLRGPYQLIQGSINENVTRVLPGAYALGPVRNEIFYVHYTGRSDSDVASRLKKHIGEHPYFKFDYFLSPKTAFEKECRIWHNFGGPEGKLDNEKHPQRPTDSNWQCPVCDIFEEKGWY